MKSIKIEIVLLFLVVYSASSFRFHEFHNASVDSKPLPYQDKIEEVFEAFGKGDIERMEKIFMFLESIEPDTFNELDDLNITTNYRNERINYVVSVCI